MRPKVHQSLTVSFLHAGAYRQSPARCGAFVYLLRKFCLLDDRTLSFMLKIVGYQFYAKIKHSTEATIHDAMMLCQQLEWDFFFCSFFVRLYFAAFPTLDARGTKMKHLTEENSSHRFTRRLKPWPKLWPRVTEHGWLTNRAKVNTVSLQVGLFFFLLGRNE